MTTELIPLENAVLLPRESIRPNPNQPRKYFDPAEIEQLRASLREYGMQQPIAVRYAPTRLDGEASYIVIAGGRRFWASEGVLSDLPCIIQDVASDRADELALIENLQRRDLTAAEEAEAVRAMMAKHDLGVRGIADKLFKSHGWVNNRLSYLKTGEDIQEVGARMPKVLSSLLLVDTVKSPAQRSELLADIEFNYAPHSAIKSRVETIKSAEAAQEAAAAFAARSKVAPDAETETRSNAAARGETAGMSRGRMVKGAPKAEANAQAKRGAAQMIAWIEHCDAKTHAEIAEMCRRIVRGDLAR